MCLNCGLVYLMDRFTCAGYSGFYNLGLYREISSLYLGVHHSIAQVRSNQTDYAHKLIQAIRGYISGGPGCRLLDIGGSAGVVALEFVKQFGVQATVLEPSAEESAAARESGLQAITGSLEEWIPQEKFEIVLLCRSVEHVFDLRRSLEKIRDLLAPNGLFYCDIADFWELSRITGAAETITKADHCYWLSHDTLPAIFRSAGFEVVSMNIIFSQAQVGFLLRACDRQPIEAMSQSRISAKLMDLCHIELAWQEAASSSQGWSDQLRRKAYRIKRKVLKSMNHRNSVSPR
jgi:SAM-dependent methyltransferase